MLQNHPYTDILDLPDRQAGLPDRQTGSPSGKADGTNRQATGNNGRAGEKDLPEGKPQRKIRAKELIDGTFLVRENMVRQLPYVLFLTFLGVIYIGNRFHAERMVRQINDLKTEVGNLRTEQITITSELMNISRPSEVAALVESKGLGLKESLEPPKKLKR